MTLYRILDAHGNEVFPGDTITDFRGEPLTFKGVGRAPEIGRSGKVYVEGRLGWFNDSVFKLQIWRRVELHETGERGWLARYTSPTNVWLVMDDESFMDVPADSVRETDEL
jgi:hypothetical protein